MKGSQVKLESKTNSVADVKNEGILDQGLKAVFSKANFRVIIS